MDTSSGVQSILGYHRCAEIVGDDLEKVRSKFQGFVKKLDAHHNKQESSRLKAVKEMDQFIQKKNKKLNLALKERPSSTHFLCSSHLLQRKYDFPFCLSIVIYKVQDLVFKHDIKKENKVEVEQLVMRCLMHQRCLIYKIPNFILLFMEQSQIDPSAKLNYLQMLTNDTQDMDPAFNPYLYVILLRLIDPTLKALTPGVLNFVLNIYQNHPRVFSETQTAQLLLKISLVGMISLEKKQLENSQEVFQIFQSFLKYNDYSPKLLNICLFTMCILSNRDPHTYPTWMVMRHLIIEKEMFVFQELVSILQIQANLPFWEKSLQPNLPGQPRGPPLNQQQLATAIQSAIRKDIAFRCFRDPEIDKFIDQKDMAAEFSGFDTNKEQDKQYSKRSTLSELVCLTECSGKLMEQYQREEIALSEKKNLKQVEIEVKKLADSFSADRQYWIEYFERNVDKIIKGAVYFTGKALWGPEKITETPIFYSINQILKFFTSLITPYTRVSVLNEVLTATKMLIANKDIPKYFEWSTILDMLELSFQHSEKMMEKKKRLDIVADIFDQFKSLLTLNQFPSFLLTRVYTLYMKYKNKKAFADLQLTQLTIDYLLRHDFGEHFVAIMDSFLIQEKQVEVRTLFLDDVLAFYGENEDAGEVGVLLESIFLNNLEQFYFTRGEQSFSTQHMIQIIDILTYMAHKTEKAASFKHIIEILEQCILCYDFDRNSQNVIIDAKQRKDLITSLTPEQLTMKQFQRHALNRLMQIFILKGQDGDETEKSVYVYNIILKILRVSANDRRQVICFDLLGNLKVNSFRELCWADNSNPLLMEICTKNFFIPLDDSHPHSNESQGNSSGSDGNATQNHLTRQLARNYVEQTNAINNRTSFDKLGQDKQIIQSTLKALVAIFEEQGTAVEIKQQALQLFHKFMPFISEEDFQKIEQVTDQQVPLHSRQPIIVDNKLEWQKMLTILLRNFDPLRESDFAFVMIDIFYTFLGLETYYKLLPQSQVVAITEELLETLFIVNNQIHKVKKLEASLNDANNPGLQGSERMKQSMHSARGPSVKDARRQMQSFAGEQPMEQMEEQVSMRVLVKIAKKVMSIVGHLFTIDTAYGAKFWNMPAGQGLPYTPLLSSADMLSGKSGKQMEKQDTKLIEYLLDQLTALSLNQHIFDSIQKHLLICLSNIAKAIRSDKEFVLAEPFLIDSVIFINLRILLPFMLSKTDYSDPVLRKKLSSQRMTKNLRDLISMSSQPLNVQEKYYMKFFTAKMDKVNSLRHLILDNIAVTLMGKSVCDELTVQQILLFSTRFDNEMVMSIRSQNIQSRSQEIQRQEHYLKHFLECLNQTVLWISHSVFDRNTHVELEPLKPGSGISHYIWNKNLISVHQKGSSYQLIVRNASYNYQAKVESQNKLQQTAMGNQAQMSKLRNILLRQAQGRSGALEKTQQDISSVERHILNDNTLMSLMDPLSFTAFKQQSKLLYLPDDEEVRMYIKALDVKQPKNSNCISVIYVPRHTSSLKNLLDIKVGGAEAVSENHFHFLSMLGEVFQVSGGEKAIKHTNQSLYLKDLDKFKESTLNFIVNEDDRNFVYFVSNVMNEKREVMEAYSKEKVQIIYNESNIQDFTRLDDKKIFIIVTKLSEQHYQIALQHSLFNAPFSNRLSTGGANESFDSHHTLSTMVEPQFHPLTAHTPRGADQKFSFNMDESEAPQSIKPTQSTIRKFNNGHLSEFAIVSQDKLGDFIKHLCLMTDLQHTVLRNKMLRIQNKGGEVLTLNVMARHQCIREFKNQFLEKKARTNTILKA